MFTDKKDSLVLTMVNREVDHKDGSGKEVWEFKVGEEIFIFTGLIKFLPKERERVIIVDFCSKTEITNNDSWTLTGRVKYDSPRVYSHVIELCCRMLPPIRKYRYVAICGDFYRESLHTRLINRLGKNVTSIVSPQIVKFLNINLQCGLDMGTHHCVVGDLN